jgi:integrase
MRTERNRDGTFNVWMSRDEYRELPRQAHSGLAEVALRLMGDCGLRVAEVPDVTAEDISRRSDGRHYKLRVTGAKDTTGTYEGGKYRETWLPVDLEATSTASSSSPPTRSRTATRSSGGRSRRSGWSALTPQPLRSPFRTLATISSTCPTRS